MRRLVTFAFLLSLAAASSGQEGEDPLALDRLSWAIYSAKPLPEYFQEFVTENLRLPSADWRAAAAYVARKNLAAELRSVVQKALEDPDIIVRRVAAETLFGNAALRKQTAERYRYVDALAAEAAAQEMAERMRGADLMTQYRATRELIALGRPAAWQIHILAHDGDEAIARSAEYASQETHRLNGNVPPLWLQRLNEKLEQRVSLELKDASLAEVLRELLTPRSIEYELYAPHWDPDWKMSLSFADVPVRKALETLLWSHDLDYSIWTGQVLVRGLSLGSGYRPVFIDVRDLKATGFDLDWGTVFRRALPADHADQIFLYRYSKRPFASPLGFLRFNIPDHTYDRIRGFDNWEGYVTPVLAHLNDLREERGLPRGAE